MKIIKLLLFFVTILATIACSPPDCTESMPTNQRLDSTNEQNVAMDGYDVTAFFTAKKAVKGDAKFQSQKDGVIYHFADAQAKGLFDANPQQYIPQFGGFCAVAASFYKVEPVEIDLFDVYEGKLYFARNKKAQKMWKKDKEGIKKGAEKLWPCLVIENGRSI